MAEIETSGEKDKGKVRAKKQDIHVDMTPMVDLAFLLITFFMLTTTMSQPVAMQLAVPRPPDEDKIEETSEAVKESQVLTIIMEPRSACLTTCPKHSQRQKILVVYLLIL